MLSATRQTSSPQAILSPENCEWKTHTPDRLASLDIFIPPKTWQNVALSFAPPGAGLLLVRIEVRATPARVIKQVCK